MPDLIIRNDDIAFDTNPQHLRQFCEICDQNGFKIIQAITPIGLGGHYINVSMQNEEIKLTSFNRFEENKEVVSFLKKRADLIGVHGLWHTHTPTIEEIKRAKEMLEEIGLTPTYFVPPFNEGKYEEEVCGLKTSKLSLKLGERLEDFLDKGKPTSSISYLHSWRFDGSWYTLKQLDDCLSRLKIAIQKLSDLPVTPYRLWYNDWIRENARGRVLDVGKSQHWNYGFSTLDTNPHLSPNYVDDILDVSFSDNLFDTVLCNGMYEYVDNPQKMITEAIRITKRGGKIIFGFVGKDYKPYLSPWKYYEGKELLPPHERKDFGNEYHFLIVEKQ